MRYCETVVCRVKPTVYDIQSLDGIKEGDCMDGTDTPEIQVTAASKHSYFKYCYKGSTGYTFYYIISMKQSH